MKFKMSGLIVFVCFTTIVATEKAIDVIVKNKAAIIENLLACTLKTSNLKYQCYFAKKDTLLQLLKGGNKLSSDQKKRINEIYLFNIERIAYANSSRLWISDSISIYFLIESLCSDNDDIAGSAFRYLFNFTAITELKRYRDKIKQSLNKSKASLREVELLALATDTNFYKTYKPDSLSLDYKVKKFLEDTAAESRLIAEFSVPLEDLYSVKERQVAELAFRGNRRCIETLILHFNKPVFSHNQACTSGTLRVPIIKNISRLYPDVTLLNDSLYIIEYDESLLYNRDVVRAYFRKFLVWAKEEFGVEPLDPELPPVISQGCRIH